MKIYVASSWKNDQQPTVVAALRAEGHEVYDYKDPAHGFPWKEAYPKPLPWTAREFVAALEHPLAIDGFKADRDAIVWCDALVMIQKCGNSAHLELGYAAGLGKHTYVILIDGQEPELMLRVADCFCFSTDEVIRRLRDERPADYHLALCRAILVSLRSQNTWGALQPAILATYDAMVAKVPNHLDLVAPPGATLGMAMDEFLVAKKKALRIARGGARSGVMSQMASMMAIRAAEDALMDIDSDAFNAAVARAEPRCRDCGHIRICHVSPKSRAGKIPLVCEDVPNECCERFVSP